METELGYYSDKLSAERLMRVYEIASPRLKQYLDCETEFVRSRLNPSSSVLELGCGYGRVMKLLHSSCREITGIDSSVESMMMAATYLSGLPDVSLYAMDASRLAFQDGSFDVVVCIQNGISAFHIDPLLLISESIRVTRSGGRVLFSSYSEKFWDERLCWFEEQSSEGLLGEIDYEHTGDGIIVCKDGFRATTFAIHDFERLLSNLGVEGKIIEVDESSIFCEITVS